jgi:hypothetical protein
LESSFTAFSSQCHGVRILLLFGHLDRRRYIGYPEKSTCA